jgi:Protein of unknown function (DUF664)
VKSSTVLLEAFGRLPGLVERAVEDLSPDELSFRIDAEANTIAWLVWHLTRIQDDHVADAATSEQIWTAKGWFDRFGLPFDQSATGYGQSADEVGDVRVTSSLLAGYFAEVHAQSVRLIESLADADLDRIVDRAWDPPVTLGARLVSVLSDDLQHCGQAALIRGVVLRRRPT